jgi:YfiH family protein
MAEHHAPPVGVGSERPPYAVVANWAAPAHVRAFTTTRAGPGVSPPPFDALNLGLRSGDDVAHALANRARLRADAALPAEPAWLHQVHGAGVVRIDRPARVGEAEPEADAAVTDVPGVVLAILTADCLPVLLCDRAGTEVGAAHAGWRGLAGGVLEATVRAMRSAPGELLAWLGPAAGPASYEVGAEVREAFLRGDAAAAGCFVATRAGHWRVDLYALATQRLRAAGVGEIAGGGFDTIADARFYSHRRDARTGRMATLAWIAPG